MPYDLSWYNDDHQILLIDSYGEVSWDQWHLAIDKSINMTKEIPHSVYIVIRDKVGMPSGNPIPHMKTTMTKVGKQGGFEGVIVVSMKARATFAQRIMDIVFRFIPVKSWPIIPADSFEEALALIKKKRPEIQI